MDQSEIAQHIEDAERRYIKPILGDTFYSNLIDFKLTDTCNYNEDKGAIIWKYANLNENTSRRVYERLFQKHLYKLSAYAVWHQALPFIGVKSTNAGIMLNNTEFAQNIGFEGVRFLQQQILDNINARQQELKDYLKDNESDFTAAGYGTDTDDCEVKTNTYNSGIIFH